MKSAGPASLGGSMRNDWPTSMSCLANTCFLSLISTEPKAFLPEPLPAATSVTRWTRDQREHRLWGLPQAVFNWPIEVLALSPKAALVSYRYEVIGEGATGNAVEVLDDDGAEPVLALNYIGTHPLRLAPHLSRSGFFGATLVFAGSWAVANRIRSAEWKGAAPIVLSQSLSGELDWLTTLGAVVSVALDRGVNGDGKGVSIATDGDRVFVAGVALNIAGSETRTQGNSFAVWLAALHTETGELLWLRTIGRDVHADLVLGLATSAGDVLLSWGAPPDPTVQRVAAVTLSRRRGLDGAPMWDVQLPPPQRQFHDALAMVTAGPKIGLYGVQTGTQAQPIVYWFHPDKTDLGPGCCSAYDLEIGVGDFQSVAAGASDSAFIAFAETATDNQYDPMFLEVQPTCWPRSRPGR